MSRREFNPSRGHIKRTVLFHTMEEGVVTAATLHALTGLQPECLRSAFQRTRCLGLIEPAPREVTPYVDRLVRGYCLTAKGIEAALLVEKSEVIFAVEGEAA
jgi:hypothetical protein